MSEPLAAPRAAADEEERDALNHPRRLFLLLDETPVTFTAIEEVRESPFARALSRLAARWPQVGRWAPRRPSRSSAALSATEETVD